MLSPKGECLINKHCPHGTGRPYKNRIIWFKISVRGVTNQVFDKEITSRSKLYPTCSNNNDFV